MKNRFFEQINRIDKPRDRMVDGKRGRTSDIRNEKDDSTEDFVGRQRILRKHAEQLHVGNLTGWTSTLMAHVVRDANHANPHRQNEET